MAVSVTAYARGFDARVAAVMPGLAAAMPAFAARARSEPTP